MENCIYFVLPFPVLGEVIYPEGDDGYRGGERDSFLQRAGYILLQKVFFFCTIFLFAIYKMFTFSTASSVKGKMMPCSQYKQQLSFKLSSSHRDSNFYHLFLLLVCFPFHVFLRVIWTYIAYQFLYIWIRFIWEIINLAITYLYDSGFDSFVFFPELYFWSWIFLKTEGRRLQSHWSWNSHLSLQWSLLLSP